MNIKKELKLFFRFIKARSGAAVWSSLMMLLLLDVLGFKYWQIMIPWAIFNGMINYILYKWVFKHGKV